MPLGTRKLFIDTTYGVLVSKVSCACGSKVRSHFLLLFFALCEREKQ